MLSILTHLAAALAPILAFLVWRRVHRWRTIRRFSREFWARQSAEGLSAVGVLNGAGVPEPPAPVPQRAAAQMALQTISLARDDGLFELLDRRPAATEEEISEHLGFAGRQVRAGLEVMWAAGVIERRGSGYALTEAGRVYLLEKSPLYDFTLPPPKMARRQFQVLRSGVSHGASRRWSRGQAERPEGWAASMHRLSFPLGFALHETGLLRDAGTVLDVAGGAGSVCIGLALKDQALRLQMLELPGSVPSAERMIAKYGLSDRIECVGADMFNDEWPSGFGAVLFSNIFHDWDDERCRSLADRARAALRPGGRILVQEALLNDDGPGPLWTAHMSLAMALTMDGRQFRGRELAALLESAGFRDVQVHPLWGYYSTVVGVRD